MPLLICMSVARPRHEGSRGDTETLTATETLHTARAASSESRHTRPEESSGAGPGDDG